MGYSSPSVSRRGPQETQERPKEVQCVSAPPWGVLRALEAFCVRWRRCGVLLACLVFTHGDEDDASERCGQCAHEQVRICASFR